MFHSSFLRRLAIIGACALLMTISLPLTMSPQAALAQSSTVSINPNQGQAGTQVTGTGSNWTAGDHIQVSWADDGSILGNTTVQSNDTFTVGFKIPSNAGLGGHTIYFTDLDSRYFLTPVFKVTALRLQAVYTTDGNQNPKTAFSSGNSINYHIDVVNTSNSSLQVNVSFAALLPNNQVIINKTYPVNMAPGLSRFYTPSDIPGGASGGTYTYSGTVYEPANGSDMVRGSSKFSVTRVLTNPLNVPLYSQFWKKENPKSYTEDCGPTSVAMTVNFYWDWHDTPAERIGVVRSEIVQYDGNATNGTNSKELESVFDHLGPFSYSEISNSTAFPDVINQMQSALNQGYPIIAFVDGTKLGDGRTYIGHWFVIAGISSNGQTVYVNDPDSDFAGGSGNEGGGPNFHQIAFPMSVYQKAAQSGTASQGQPYGIIVKGLVP